MSLETWYRSHYLPDRLIAFGDLMRAARLSRPAFAAQFLGVSVESVRRWLRQGSAPEWARLLLAMRAGHMPWADWEDWRIVPEGLQLPEYARVVYSPRDLLTLPLLYQRLRTLRSEVRSFHALADQAAIERDQPPSVAPLEPSHAAQGPGMDGRAQRPPPRPLPALAPSGVEASSESIPSSQRRIKR